MTPFEDEIFDDEFMNDMLLNPEAYGIYDGLKERDQDEDCEE